jgi:hypothetical protein
MRLQRAKTRRTPRHIRMSVFVALLVGLTIITASPADAFKWRTGVASLGCYGIVNSADSAAHGFYYSPDLTYAMANATNYARTFVIDPSDINTFTVPSVAIDTDVVVYDQDYSTYCDFSWNPAGQAVGLTTCVSLATNPANACEKHEVRYDESYVNWASTAARYSIACHENGHTLGLEHTAGNDGSCMYGSANSQYGWGASQYSDINSHY